MNARLSTEFKAWEVEQLIKQMAPLKAPGPDGISPLFYQHYWNLVGDDVCQSVLNFLGGESIGVWLDAWLPSYDHPRILSPTVDGFEEAGVADLIDPDTRQWDSCLLQGLFNPHEVDLIRSIPLCNSYAKAS